MGSGAAACGIIKRNPAPTHLCDPLPAVNPAPFEGDPYRPVSARRRILIVVLAVATASSLLLYMLGRRGQIEADRPHKPTEVATCAAGQTTGCVGGLATVIIAPAAGASAP